MKGPFYIADLRPEWDRKPYVTFWRPKNAGYAFPLPWSGRYSREEIDAHPGYYANLLDGDYTRFPVSCAVVDALATSKPAAHIIDGDVGPVVPNTQAIQEALREAAYLPAAASADTHPKDGDGEAAPLVSGAVPEGQTPKSSINPPTPGYPNE